jgi:hypothetical protein
MPKSSGQDHKAVQLPPSRPQPKSRGINHQPPLASSGGRPMAPGASKFADALDQRDPGGGIDPDQH